MSIISRLVSKSKHRTELKKAEANLAELRRNYKAGTFSGHPEEMLWDIDDAELRVKTLKNAL